jgi:hypothetical protein
MKINKITNRMIASIQIIRLITKVNSIKIKNLIKVTPMFIYLEWV